MISHYHITLTNVSSDDLIRSSKLIQAKPTPIDLLDHRGSHFDRMVTKYQKGIDLTQMNRDVEILNENGFEVTRFKLEQMIESFDGFELSDQNYFEVHIKVPNTYMKKDVFGFAYSSNPSSMGYYFYNGRCRSLDDLPKFKETIELIKSETEVESVHMEYTVFDSNTEHDRWWA